MTAPKTTRNAVLLPREPLFVRLHGRAVHVVDNATTASHDQYGGYGDPALAPHHAELEKSPTRSIGQGPVDPLASILGDVATRCGRTISRHVGGLEQSGAFVTQFDDDDLCRACWGTVRPEDQDRLFEHPQADGSTEIPDAHADIRRGGDH